VLFRSDRLGRADLQDQAVRENDGRKLGSSDARGAAVTSSRAGPGGSASGGRRADAGAAPQDGVRVAGEVPGGWPEALAAKPVPGRPPKLSDAQIAGLYELSSAPIRPLRIRDPGDGATGDPPRVQRRVERGQRRRLLCTTGLSPQPPLHRAYQQNPEAVQGWKDEQPLWCGSPDSLSAERNRRPSRTPGPDDAPHDRG